MEIKIKRTIAILLAVCFLVSLTATAVSAENGNAWGSGNNNAGGNQDPGSNAGGNHYGANVNGHSNYGSSEEYETFDIIPIILH